MTTPIFQYIYVTVIHEVGYLNLGSTDWLFSQAHVHSKASGC